MQAKGSSTAQNTLKLWSSNHLKICSSFHSFLPLYYTCIIHCISCYFLFYTHKKIPALQFFCNVFFNCIIKGATQVDLGCDVSVYLSSSSEKESSLFPKKVSHILFVSVQFPAESMPQAPAYTSCCNLRQPRHFSSFFFPHKCCHNVDPVLLVP